MFCLILSMLIGFVLVGSRVDAQSERVVDIPTRPNVTQRFLFSSPNNAKAAVILVAGGLLSVRRASRRAGDGPSGAGLGWIGACRLSPKRHPRDKSPRKESRKPSVLPWA